MFSFPVAPPEGEFGHYKVLMHQWTVCVVPDRTGLPEWETLFVTAIYSDQETRILNRERSSITQNHLTGYMKMGLHNWTTPFRTFSNKIQGYVSELSSLEKNMISTHSGVILL